MEEIKTLSMMPLVRKKAIEEQIITLRHLVSQKNLEASLASRELARLQGELFIVEKALKKEVEDNGKEGNKT